jgi:hypothetical protein
MTKQPEISQQRLTAVQTACVHLLAARALLRNVGANEAAEYVQRALKGAERHATRLGARPRKATALWHEVVQAEMVKHRNNPSVPVPPHGEPG